MHELYLLGCQMVTVLTKYVSNQIASRLRAHSCKAVRCSRQKGSVDLYAHIKFRQLREIATFNYWEGSEASCFQNKTGAQLGFYYQTNAKVWMTTKIYQEWLQEWD